MLALCSSTNACSGCHERFTFQARSPQHFHSRACGRDKTCCVLSIFFYWDPFSSQISICRCSRKNPPHTPVTSTSTSQAQIAKSCWESLWSLTRVWCSRYPFSGHSKSCRTLHIGPGCCLDVFSPSCALGNGHVTATEPVHAIISPVLAWFPWISYIGPRFQQQHLKKTVIKTQPNLKPKSSTRLQPR